MRFKQTELFYLFEMDTLKVVNQPTGCRIAAAPQRSGGTAKSRN